MKPLLEIAVFSQPGIDIALNAGADRVEVCRNYKAGGLTPDYYELKELPVSVLKKCCIMIRPRAGNFVYSQSEIKNILNTVHEFTSLPIGGIVTGALQISNEADEIVMKEIVQISKDIPVTFHRAFDETPDQYRTIDNLKKQGVKRILSASWIEKSVSQAVLLMKYAEPEIQFITGGSIRSNNILPLVQAGFREIHSSAITNSSELPDKKEINKMLQILNSVHEK